MVAGHREVPGIGHQQPAGHAGSRGLVDERPRQDGETLVAEPVFDLVCVRIGVHDKNNTMRGARPWPRRWT